MWDAFKDAIFICIDFFYNFVHDWGLAIVIVTLIFRLVLFPLMQKQIKSTFQMQKFSPLMQEIQTKYADDKQRQSAEMQKLYAESGFNPLAGCLPMILQMPIFIALFQVLYDMNNRTGGSDYTFYNILPNLVASPSNAWATGFGAFLPYGILLIIFAGATFLPTLLQQVGTNNPQKNQQIFMMVIMTLMMLWIGWGSPAGVLLFWATSSVFAVVQQQVTLRILRRKDREQEALEADIKPVKVDVTRKAKKPRPTKKTK
jgi:YidC/Oxa1 family membrane protein insertase